MDGYILAISCKYIAFEFSHGFDFSMLNYSHISLDL
jgi:hypothetical protein